MSQIRFKKEGGGSLRLNGRMIKPGQIFTADPNDIPAAFRDTCIAQEPFDFNNIQPKEIPIVDAPVYTLSPAKRKGWFDIIDVNGKKLTEKALKEDAAIALLTDLGVDVSNITKGIATEEIEETGEKE